MSEPEILFEHSGKAGVITLNRPSALNALTMAMVEAVSAALERWAGDDAVRHVIIRANGGRAFCAGGDIRALYDWGRAKDPKFFDFFRAEYMLNTQIKRFPKPYVAMIDGITMGGGVGVSVHGSHRVASERLVFAMPETGIGFFPDVGGTYFLPRLPGQAGMYFGLTGDRGRIGDACYAGIATHHVPSDRLGELAEALTKADSIDECLADFVAEPEPGVLKDRQSDIDRHFGRNSVEAILASLDADPSDWAQKTAATLRGKSPTSLKVAFRQLREGRKRDFEDCMRLEYRIVHGIAGGHDFYEGIRAAVIDKDGQPRWRPSSLEEVSEVDVAAYFEPVADELPV
ncbi:MAG TPA: enoyl-CoA hydratase/isomerase family protein [Aestuariivirgaceae bacterium]|nr:enoyl-CoA hydratase/isomerase family protein [Aestuariivirgaceae bacterium]